MHNPPHPGEILRELYMAPLDLSVTDVAKGIGVTRKSLSELLNGHSGVSPTMSIRLAEAFDTTPEHWLNLQQEYNLWKAQDEINRSKITHFYTSGSTTLSPGF
jgi:addiction module HigA family antidote